MAEPGVLWAWFGFGGDEAAKTDLDLVFGDSGEEACNEVGGSGEAACNCNGVGDRDSGASEGDTGREWDAESFGIKGGAGSDDTPDGADFDEFAGVADSGETRDAADSDEAADAADSDETTDTSDSHESAALKSDGED